MKDAVRLFGKSPEESQVILAGEPEKRSMPRDQSRSSYNTQPDKENEMRRFRQSRSSLASSWAVLLASLLLLSGLAAAACSRAEPPSEEAPASTASEVESPTDTTGENPPAAEEITITGRMPPGWVEEEVMVGPGDTILWKVENGRHGLRFPLKADCDLALATMTFSPPLDPIADGGCQSKVKNQPGDLIVSATVNLALSRDLPYDCVIHRAAMPGVLKPK